MESNNFFKYTLLYIPFILSFLLKDFPHASYFTAWIGSFVIFYLVYSEKITNLPKDLPILDQLLRPVFLMHFIFAGYMACTSIFYYLNALGYQYLTKIDSSIVGDYIVNDIAGCQRYYILGHAALVHGLLFKMRYHSSSNYQIRIKSMSSFLFQLSIICLPVSFLFEKISFLNQFSVQLQGLSFVSGTIALAFALKERKNTLIMLCLLLFTANFLKATTSGFKEPIFICVLLLGLFLIPVYGKKIIPLFSTILVSLMIILPTFIGAYRNISYHGGDQLVARQQGIDAVLETNYSQNVFQENYWIFLTNRLSEIDMFINYTKSTPQFVPYYKFSILKQSLELIVPRFFWSNKPVTEETVMDRVYKAGIIDPNAAVSAKPAYIVDCFLSYGYIGVWVGLFSMGFIAQAINNHAESIFGGYFLGSAVMFAGLFQIFWRGNSLEFMFNTVFWSFFTMQVIFYILRAKGNLFRN